ncbi:hypothetical protein [Streptomyces synnematoformans]|uniref:Uncharacterized protein n=1 Tax=Streptomyces synnematoformans TaxID=415721 RepID=A0ABN2XAB1_9ACTN
MARRAAQEWNRGMVGTSAVPRDVTPPGECATDGCGRPVGTEVTPTGWVVAQVIGSGPAREYCSGSCSSYGVALAEVRALRDKDGGDDR